MVADRHSVLAVERHGRQRAIRIVVRCVGARLDRCADPPKAGDRRKIRRKAITNELPEPASVSRVKAFIECSLLPERLGRLE
jgi:hypothetical protein